MARIKITDLPKVQKISQTELRRIMGGKGTWHFVPNVFMNILEEVNGESKDTSHDKWVDILSF